MWEKIKDWCYWHEGFVTFIFACICSLLIVGGLLKYESQFYLQEETMIVEVTEMNEWTTKQNVLVGKVIVPRTQYHYQLICGDIDFKVDSTVYASISVGDRIIINCKYKYRKDNNALVDASYEYAGE